MTGSRLASGGHPCIILHDDKAAGSLDGTEMLLMCIVLLWSWIFSAPRLHFRVFIFTSSKEAVSAVVSSTAGDKPDP